MLRFLVLILACSTTVFGEETTLAPTSYVEDGNDQEPSTVFLNEESETETFEDSKIFGEDEDIDLFPEEDENIDLFPEEDEDIDFFPEEDEGIDSIPEDEELGEEQAEEGESNADDGSNQTEGEIVEGEGDDIEIEPESDFVNDTKNTTLVEPIEDTNSDIDDALEPSDPNKDQEEGDGDGDGDMLPGELLGGNSEGGAGGEGGVDEFAFSETVDPGLNDITEAPTSDEFSDFAPTSTQVETPYIAPTPDAASPTTYRPPTLPYVSTDYDPLKEADDNEWTWNDSTIEEMEHDKTVIIALSVVFGLMFFFSIFAAYQLLENPDGWCSSICRITVACWCGIARCIFYPCRSMCGCTGQSGGQHMIVPDDGHFTHDLELS